MAMKTKNNKLGSGFGCGFMARILQFKNYRLKNSSVHSLPIKPSNNNNDHTKNEPKLSPKKEQIIEPQKLSLDQLQTKKRITKKHSDSAAVARISTSSSSIGSCSIHTKVQVQQNLDIITTQNSLEIARFSSLESNKSLTKDFVPLKITGNLIVNNSPRRKSVECLPKNSEFNSMMLSSYSGNNNNGKKVVMGNIMRKNSNELAQFLSPRNNKVVDSEVLKCMGNEAYKKGKFEEALNLYDRAISLDSNKAIYHCNKSAALIGLGRFQEAIIECKESIKLDPSYNRAHNRLATIYFRLGEAEKALDCNRSTLYGDSVLDFQVQALQNHLKKCNEARKVKEWSLILKETQSALSLGCDSAPQIYALQTEALLKLLRYQEAFSIYEKMPKFSLDWCKDIFGLATSAYLLMIGAKVYLASGRFEDAVKTAQQGAKVDPTNREVNTVFRSARAVTSARMSGNLLFKASKFKEACAVYNEGLEHDPHNSVLLCNRAACRSKLGQLAMSSVCASSAIAAVAISKPSSQLGGPKASFLSGRKLRVNKKTRTVKGRSSSSTTVCVAAEPERPIWFPGSTPPPWLDGSLPGDFGFDPLGLGSDPESLRWNVQAELVHCRWAMLGAAGIFIPEFLTKIGILNTPSWYTAGEQEYFTDTTTLFIVELFFIGWAEGRRWADIIKPGSVNTDPIFPNNKLTGTDVGYPGGLWFDPLGWGSGSPQKIKELRTKEIKNGRLAMLAVLGAWFQHVYTGTGPIDNLFAHLADPGHATIFAAFTPK